MTAQSAERLHYEGEEHALCGCPLEHYFAMGGHRPDFQRTSTGLWRRYCSVAFCLELKREFARISFCRISRAVLVQMNGLGSVL